MSEPRTVVHEIGLDGVTIEYDDVAVDGDHIERLMTAIFSEHWADVTVGPLVEGAAFEIRFTAPPNVTMLDGYLTVDTGPWHFHLCVNDHTGTPSMELRRIRRVARAAFFRKMGESDVPMSWGLRLWNGRGEQMISVLFPNPRYGEHGNRLAQPRWEKTKLWEDLRAQYAQEAPGA